MVNISKKTSAKDLLKEADELKRDAEDLQKRVIKSLDNVKGMKEEVKGLEGDLARTQQVVRDTQDYLVREQVRTRTFYDWVRRLFRGGRNYFLFFGAIFLILSLFFFSPNITGNSILSFNEGSYNLMGGAFFILAIVGFFIYFKK